MTTEEMHEVRLAGQVGEMGQAIRELAEERDRLGRELDAAAKLLRQYRTLFGRDDEADAFLARHEGRR